MTSNWRNSTIGEQATLQRGIDITRKEQRLGPIPVVSSGGVGSYHDIAHRAGPGVILGRKGVVGSVWFINGPYWPHDTTLWVKDFHGNDERFVFYFFKFIAPQIAQMDVGSANPTLNRNHVHPMQITWPPLPEQKAIAQILGSLDDKIELNRRRSRTLESMARAIFQSWFVDFDPVKAKAAGRQPEGLSPKLAALFPDRFEDSELGFIPAGWQNKQIGNIVSLQRGKTYKSGLKGLPGPVLLGLGSIERNGGFRDNNLSTYGGECPDNLVLEPGDIYVSLKDVTQSADLLGAVARVPPHIESGRLTQDTVALRFVDSAASRSMLYLTLLTSAYRDYCRAHATGTTNLGLSREDFLAYPIVEPSIALRRWFDEFSRSMDDDINRCLTESRTLAASRDTLLPKLISGELRVPDAERFLGRVI